MKCQDCPFYDKGECNSIEHMNHYDNGHSLGYAEGLRDAKEIVSNACSGGYINCSAVESIDQKIKESK